MAFSPEPARAGHGAAATHDANTTAAWMTEATADLKAPTIGGNLRWVQRAALAKAAQTVAERRLSQLQIRERDAHLRALGCGISAWEEAIMKDAPGPAEMAAAEADLSEATVALELAERVGRLLERARVIGQQAAKPPLGVQQGGKR
jgi:hypothetical protein